MNATHFRTRGRPDGGATGNFQRISEKVEALKPHGFTGMWVTGDGHTVANDCRMAAMTSSGASARARIKAAIRSAAISSTASTTLDLPGRQLRRTDRGHKRTSAKHERLAVLLGRCDAQSAPGCGEKLK